MCADNGVLTVLELIATLDGGSIATESKFSMLSFMQQEQRMLAMVMAVCLFVSLAFILLLSFMQVVSVIQLARGGEGFTAFDILEVFYDVSQGARCFHGVLLCLCATVLD